MNDIDHELLLSAYLDDEASESERALVEKLLVENADFRRLRQELVALRQRLQTLPKQKLDPDFARRVVGMARVRAAELDASGLPLSNGEAIAPEATHAPAPTKPLDVPTQDVAPVVDLASRTAKPPLRHGSHFWQWSAAAIAAAVLLGVPLILSRPVDPTIAQTPKAARTESQNHLGPLPGSNGTFAQNEMDSAAHGFSPSGGGGLGGTALETSSAPIDSGEKFRARVMERQSVAGRTAGESLPDSFATFLGNAIDHVEKRTFRLALRNDAGQPAFSEKEQSLVESENKTARSSESELAEKAADRAGNGEAESTENGRNNIHLGRQLAEATDRALVVVADGRLARTFHERFEEDGKKVAEARELDDVTTKPEARDKSLASTGRVSQFDDDESKPSKDGIESLDGATVYVIDTESPEAEELLAQMAVPSHEAYFLSESSSPREATRDATVYSFREAQFQRAQEVMDESLGGEPVEELGTESIKSAMKRNKKAPANALATDDPAQPQSKSDSTFTDELTTDSSGDLTKESPEKLEDLMLRQPLREYSGFLWRTEWHAEASLADKKEQAGGKEIEVAGNRRSSQSRKELRKQDEDRGEDLAALDAPPKPLAKTLSDPKAEESSNAPGSPKMPDSKVPPALGKIAGAGGAPAASPGAAGGMPPPAPQVSPPAPGPTVAGSAPTPARGSESMERAKGAAPPAKAGPKAEKPGDPNETKAWPESSIEAKKLGSDDHEKQTLEQASRRPRWLVIVVPKASLPAAKDASETSEPQK